MDMRIEFEAVMAKQLSSEGYSDFSIEMMFERGSDDEYRSIRVNGAYWGWQASRESLVVELPEGNPLGSGPGDHGDGRPSFEQHCAVECNFIIRDCRDAIHAAGIRTK